MSRKKRKHKERRQKQRRERKAKHPNGLGPSLPLVALPDTPSSPIGPNRLDRRRDVLNEKKRVYRRGELVENQSWD